MLKDHPIDPVLLSRDLQRSRRFYEQGLNLPLIVAREHMLVYQVGGMGRITVSLSTTGSADTQTQASWRVGDLQRELAELRGRGVKIEDYDTEDVRTEGGVADVGFAWAAWVVDPDGNTLGILQLKD